MGPFSKTIRVAAACVTVAIILAGCADLPSGISTQAAPAAPRHEGTGVFIGGGYNTVPEDTTERGGVFVGGGY